MITDNDREDLIEDIRAYNDGWMLEEGKDRDRLIEFENVIRAESAEQARKEAADRAVEWFKTVFCVPESARTKGLRAAIIGDSVTVSTDSEKLAIAVKALEYVVSKGMPSNVFESQYSRLQDACTTAGDALKEIQG